MLFSIKGKAHIDGAEIKVCVKRTSVKLSLQSILRFKFSNSSGLFGNDKDISNKLSTYPETLKEIIKKLKMAYFQSLNT